MRCFVIGPIGDQLAEPGSLGRDEYEQAVQVFEEVIKAACTPFEIDAYRADEIDDPGEIPEQIFEALRDEQLVIADLTGANPNVMYELGIRHVTGKCTLQIGEKNRLPFDVNTIRTVQFKRTPAGLIAAQKKLSSLIGSALANGCKDSVAARILRTTEESGRSSAGDDLSTSEDLLDVEDADEQPLGFLEAMVTLEDALPEMAQRLSNMTILIERIGTLSVTYQPRFERATKPTQKLASVAAYSRELEPLAREYDQESVEFGTRTSIVDLAVAALLDHIESGGGNLEEAVPLITSLKELADAAQVAGEEGISGFHNRLAPLEGISRELRPVIRLLRNATARTISDFDRVVAWGSRARGLSVA